jgi:hypothetical protein
MQKKPVFYNFESSKLQFCSKSEVKKNIYQGCFKMIKFLLEPNLYGLKKENFHFEFPISLGFSPFCSTITEF